jgi:hypothetical protein
MHKYLLGVALMVLGAIPAYPHDASHAKTATEAAVFDFYATWMRPPGRSYSCCNMNDCHVVEIKREGGRYSFLDRLSFGAPLWREIPEDRLEHNAADPRESPDGSSHVCFNSMYVLCAVLGSGQ